MGRATILDKSVLLDKTLSEINLEEEIGCDVIAIQRKRSWTIHPPDSWQLKNNDRVIARGTGDSIRKLQRLAAGELKEIT